MLRLIGAHRILRGANQTARHQRVEDADHYQRNDVVGEKLGEHHHLGVPGAEVLRKGIAHLHLVAGLHLKLQHVGVVGAGSGQQDAQQPDEGVGLRQRVPPLVGEVANRVVGGGVPLDAQSGQREDGDADRQVAGELADLAHQQAVGPRLEGVDGADEGDADEDEGEVAGGQREDVHVGDGAHRLVLVEDVDDGAVADGAQHEDQQEDERDDVGLRTGLVGDVAAAAAAGVGAVHTTSGSEGTRATGSGGGGGRQWCVVQHVQRVAAGCGGGGGGRGRHICRQHLTDDGRLGGEQRGGEVAQQAAAQADVTATSASLAAVTVIAAAAVVLVVLVHFGAKMRFFCRLFVQRVKNKSKGDQVCHRWWWWW